MAIWTRQNLILSVLRLKTLSEQDKLQIFVIIQGIEAINANMRLCRFGTPAHLRELAKTYTGKIYSKSRKGLLEAHADLLKLI